MSLSNFFSKKAPVSSQKREHSESATYQCEMKKQKVDIPETTTERSTETSLYQQDEAKKQKVEIPRTPTERSISFQLIKEEEIRDQIIISFKNVFHDIDDNKIHNYYICKSKNCNLCSRSCQNVKRQQIQLFDPKLAFCDKTHKWCLTDIDGKGMLCALCRIYNTKHGNESKVWNSTGNVRCRTETSEVTKSHPKDDDEIKFSID